MSVFIEYEIILKYGYNYIQQRLLNESYFSRIRYAT